MNAIESFIQQYIVASYLDDGPSAGRTVTIDDDLLTLLDSLQFLRMLLELESQYAIKVDNSELSPDNLGTIRRLAKFVAAKQEAAVFQGAPS